MSQRSHNSANANPRHQARGLVVLLVLTLTACATPSASPTGTHPGPHPSWPPAPAPARVTHIRNITGAASITNPGFFDRLGLFVTGAPQKAMARPSSVAVRDGRFLCVSDQELQGILLLDLQGGSTRFVDRLGKDRMVSPVGVAWCGTNLAVSDSALLGVFLLDENQKLLRRLDKPGGWGRPTGLAFEPRTQQLYVVDTLAHEVVVMDLQGQAQRTIGGPGIEPGQFNFPTHVYVDGKGVVYVTDSLNFRVQAFDPSGQFLFAVGTQGDASGHLGVPKGIGVDSDGHIYIADSYFSVVQVFDRQGRFLLRIGASGEQSGQFHVPTGLTIDQDNHIYVCDSFNHRIQVFKYLGDQNNETPAIQP